MDEKDAKSQRGWQLDDFFKVLEKDKRTRGREELCRRCSRCRIREERVTKK